MNTPDEPEALRAAVRTKYAARALAVTRGDSGSCCGSGGDRSVSDDLYAPAEAGAVPPDALAASLGCGNPAAIAELREGETVLDLGSGGGIDVLLSANRVGPSGLAYGLDMTDEMLALAERNRAAAGAANARFLKGTIEEIPLPDASVDVVLSNCVINLSADKARVLREAFRVLRPGGRFAVSDIVVQGTLPDAIRRDMESWAGCVAGALTEEEYRRLLAEAGFREIEVRVTRVHGPEAAGDAGAGGRIVSASVRARRP